MAITFYHPDLEYTHELYQDLLHLLNKRNNHHSIGDADTNNIDVRLNLHLSLTSHPRSDGWVLRSCI